MGKSEITYRELEHRARMDLAVRVLSDPTAPAEHVRAARHALESAHLDPDDVARAVASFTPNELAQIRAVVDAMRERRARERTAPTTRDSSDETS